MLAMYKRTHQAGDTLIETVLALAVLSLVLLSSWALVSRATQTSLASRQRIEMVNQLKEQAEVIKALYAYNKTAVTSKKMGGTTVIGNATGITADSCADSNGVTPSNAFYLDAAGSNIEPQTGVKSVPDNRGKVWVQLVTRTGYIDFYVRGCWQTFGVQTDDNSQLRVRLNL